MNRNPLSAITIINCFLSSLSYIKCYLFFAFGIKSMFVMHLYSNQTVPNPGRVASVLMILAPALQRTRIKIPCMLQMSFSSSLLMITFTVDFLSSISHHVLTNFPNPWVSFPLFSNECLSVPLSMRLSIPVMSESIVSGLYIVSLTPRENCSKPSTYLQVYSSDKLSCIWVSHPAWLDFPPSSLLVSGQSRLMCPYLP